MLPTHAGRAWGQLSPVQALVGKLCLLEDVLNPS